MKILVTGANGYIGRRLMPVLVEAGHKIVALVRDPDRFSLPIPLRPHVEVVKGDLLDARTIDPLPTDIEGAYYLVHSMGRTGSEFAQLEQKTAHQFVDLLRTTATRHILYLSGLSHDKQLSPHLKSRQYVEQILKKSEIPTTIVRSGIIIGSGSASFEIIRDLTEKLPVMVAPKWVNNRSQPIAIHDVIYYLANLLDNERALHETFDVGGPDILTYRELLLGYAKVRHLKRRIITVPVLTPRLSSYWLYFITSTNFSLARSLVDSLKNNVVCQNHEIDKVLPHKCLSYEQAMMRAFSKIEENLVISSWKDAWVTTRLPMGLGHYVKIPKHGCVKKVTRMPITSSVTEAVDRIFAIGGANKWYYMNWAWYLRGRIDKLVGGVGLRRGRTHPTELVAGDALDFWRVVYANRIAMRILLYAEMKLPGEAWLELKVEQDPKEGPQLISTATFRPHGLLGRLYWWAMYPFHIFIFKGMARAIAQN